MCIIVTIKTNIMKIYERAGVIKIAMLILTMCVSISSSIAQEQTTNVEEGWATNLSPAELQKAMEEMTPKYPGGDKAFQKYLKQTLVYPLAAKKQHIEGKVFVSFVVDTVGNISDIKVVRSVHPLLDEEAIRVISAMQEKWIPGVVKGKTVSSPVTVPIHFHK